MKDTSNTNKNVSNLNYFQRLHQFYLERITPFVTLRWISTLVLLLIFFLRVIILKGHYLIAYGLSLFFLNQFILFLTPKEDLSLDTDEDLSRLPTKSTDEFRPFIRHLPEFKFWYTTHKALLICLFLTCFSVFDVPVFWPILVLYFFVLFILTMRQRILHMIRYRYLPYSYGRIRYSEQTN